MADYNFTRLAYQANDNSYVDDLFTKLTLQEALEAFHDSYRIDELADSITEESIVSASTGRIEALLPTGDRVTLHGDLAYSDPATVTRIEIDYADDRPDISMDTAISLYSYIDKVEGTINTVRASKNGVTLEFDLGRDINNESSGPFSLDGYTINEPGGLSAVVEGNLSYRTWLVGGNDVVDLSGTVESLTLSEYFQRPLTLTGLSLNIETLQQAIDADEPLMPLLLSGDDTISSVSKSDGDVVYGYAGNDTFLTYGEDAQLYGGTGSDTVHLQAFPYVYSLLSTSSNTYTAQQQAFEIYERGYPRPDSLSQHSINAFAVTKDTQLTDIEFLTFGTEFQTTLSIDDFLDGTLPTEIAQLTDLYLAFFSRAPDVSGLEYWQEQLIEKNRDFSTIAKDFAWSAEAADLFPAEVSNRDFIENIYQNVFERTPDLSGWDYWTDRLDALGSTDLNERGQFVAELILGAYAPSSGAEDRNLLSNRHDVAMHYVNELTQREAAVYETSINTLLAMVTDDVSTKDNAIRVINYANSWQLDSLESMMSDPEVMADLWVI